MGLLWTRCCASIQIWNGKISRKRCNTLHGSLASKSSPPRHRFVRSLADMGVSYTVVDHLRTSGHDALHLRDIGMQRMPDDEVLAMATQDKRVILTFDLDFARLAAN